MHRLYGLVGDPILPLEALPDPRTWPDLAAYPLLLGVLFGAGVLVVDFWEFPIIRFLPDREMTPFSVAFSSLPPDKEKNLTTTLYTTEFSRRKY